MKKLIAALIIVSLFSGCAASTVPDFSGVVSVRSEAGGGSGVVVARRDSGYLVVTAAHVVQFDRNPRVDGRAGKTLVLDRDEDTALVSVPDVGQDYRVRKLVEARQGEPVTALGYSYTSPEDSATVCYRGHVISTAWPSYPGPIAANCGGYPGISGGPVVNSDGECIGIIVRCATVGPGILLDSTALIVPSRVLRQLFDEDTGEK